MQPLVTNGFACRLTSDMQQGQATADVNGAAIVVHDVLGVATGARTGDLGIAAWMDDANRWELIKTSSAG